MVPRAIVKVAWIVKPWHRHGQRRTTLVDRLIDRQARLRLREVQTESAEDVAELVGSDPEWRLHTAHVANDWLSHRRSGYDLLERGVARPLIARERA